MALTDLTRISTSGIATGSTIDSPILRKDVSLRGSQVGVTSALFDSSEDELKFNDNVKLKFGDGGDLNLYHTGSHSYIQDTGAGNLVLDTNGFSIKLTYNDSETMLRGIRDKQVEIYYDDEKKFETAETGAIVTGILTATGFSGPIVGNTHNTSGLSTFYDLRVSNNLTVEGTTTTLDTNLIGVDRVEIDANSNTIAGIAVTQSGTADIVNLFDGDTKVLTVKDGGSVGIGTDNPARDFHVTGTSRFEQLDVVGFATFGSAGTRFFHHTPRIEMPGSNTATISFVNATTGTTTSDGMLMGFSSNSKAGFINVLEGSHGFVLKTGGSHASAERINISGVGTVSLRYGTTEEMVTARPNGAVELYHDGTKRLETTNTGVDIPDSLNISGDITIAEKIIHADDSDTFISFSGDDTFAIDTAGSERLRISGIGSVSIGFNGNAQRKVDIVTGDDNGVLIRSTTAAEGSEGSADAIQDLIQLRNPWGSSAHNTGNAGARFGIQMRAYNDAGDFQTKDPAKSAAIYAVSEDEFSGYWKNVGLAFYTSAYNQSQAEKVRIDTNGKVGIGTASPDGQLHISSGTSGDCRVYIEADEDNNAEGDNPFIIFKQDGGVENASVWCGNHTPGGNDNSLNLSAATSQNGGIRFFTSSTDGGWETASERVRIDQNGNLQVSTGQFTVGTTATSGLQFINDGTFGTLHNIPLIIRTASAEKMRILTDGKVGIGTTNPDELLHIFSASGNSKIVLEADNNSANNGIYWVDEQDSTQTEFYYSHPDNKQSLKVNGNGFEVYSKQTSKVTAKIGHGLGYNDVVVPNGNLGIGTDDPDVQLDIFKFTNTTGNDGTTMLRLTNHVGSNADNGDLHSPNGQQTFIDFRFLDANASFTPQVRIGAQIGNTGGDDGIQSEGNGSFVVYTGKGNDNSGGGTLTEKLRVTPIGSLGFNKTNPIARVDFGYDSGQYNHAFMQFRGPNNKSGEMLHKYIANGASGGGTVINLFEVTAWQSTNSRIFGVVKVMACNPLSNQGYQAEGWFFKSDDGNADQSTMTKVHDKGGSVGSLSWDSDTLRYTTPNTAYLSMHVSVEYHTYDGATVVFDTSSRYL